MRNKVIKMILALISSFFIGGFFTLNVFALDEEMFVGCWSGSDSDGDVQMMLAGNHEGAFAFMGANENGSDDEYHIYHWEYDGDFEELIVALERDGDYYTPWQFDVYDLDESISIEHTYSDGDILYLYKSDDSEIVLNYDETKYYNDAYSVIHSDGSNVWLVNEDGSTFASTDDGDFSTICAYGDGYYLLFTDKSGLEVGERWLDIVDSHGNYLMEKIYYPSDVNYEQYKGIEYIERYDTSPFDGDYFKYYGDGVFAYTSDQLQGDGNSYVQFVNCKSKTSFTINTMLFPDFSFDDSGYVKIVLEDSWATFFVSAIDGVIGQTGTYDNCGDFSDGGFLYSRASMDMATTSLYFFDCETKTTVTLMENEPRLFAGIYEFVDGEAEIQFNGADGNIYYATIDKLGNYIMEPHL